MVDLAFIGGDFLYDDLPPDLSYLRRYFKTAVEIRFLVYYLVFHQPDSGFTQKFYHNFIEHTGYPCTERWVYKLMSRLRRLEVILEKAMQLADLDTIVRVKGGKQRL